MVREDATIDRRVIADRIASQFEDRWLREYVRAKVRLDPAYEAAWEAFSGSDLPVLDIGCGVGLLGFYLRARGYRGWFIGIDADASKIARAWSVGGGEPDLRFEVRDAIDDLAF